MYISAEKIRRKSQPYYRIVVMDSRSARDSKTIDELGYYHPIETEDKQLNINETKAREWLSKGALPSDTVRSLFNKKGIRLG